MPRSTATPRLQRTLLVLVSLLLLLGWGYLVGRELHQQQDGQALKNFLLLTTPPFLFPLLAAGLLLQKHRPAASAARVLVRPLAFFFAHAALLLLGCYLAYVLYMLGALALGGVLPTLNGPFIGAVLVYSGCVLTPCWVLWLRQPSKPAAVSK